MKCFNGGDRHKFEPRYDEVPSNNLEFKGPTNFEAIRKLMISNIYVKDVCVWCGKEIKK